MSEAKDESKPGAHRPSRLESEVAEILARADEPASFTEHVRRKAQYRAPTRPPLTQSLPDLRTLGPGSYLIGTFLFALLGAMTRGFSPFLAMLLAILSVVCLVMVWVRRSPPGIGGQKMWRGRDLDLGPGTPPWVDAMRDRFRRPPRL